MSSKSKNQLPGGNFRRVVRVRNAQGKALMCCYDDCHRDGNNLVQVTISNPLDKTTPTIYIFCSETHKMAFIQRSQGQR